MNLFTDINIYSIRFIISLIIFSTVNFILIKIFIRYSSLFNFLDIPNNRSSHLRITPKGAGIVFSLTSILFIFLIFKISNIVILLPLLIVGFIDDYKPVSSLLRYIVQLLSSSFIVYNSALFENLSLSKDFTENVLIFMFLVFVSTAVINFFNFSDGIDGLVASTGFIYFIFIGFIINPIFLVVASSLLVFLFFNWSPAKVFMGDVGSTFIGSIVVISALTQVEYIEAFSLIMMICPVLIDPFFCVLRRLIAKENIFIA